MSFNNSGYIPVGYNNLAYKIRAAPKPAPTNVPVGHNNLAYNISAAPKPAPTNIPLNAPMIDRVHKAKPGCSACGKKVA